MKVLKRGAERSDRGVYIISDYLKEETLSTSYLYRGRIINVRQDRVKMHGGQTVFREIVEHPGAVAILALNDQGEAVLVRQHRQPTGEILLEIPAGKLEANETPLECAQRELLEETGLKSAQWRELCSFYPSPGFCNEIIYLFQAETLTEAVSPTSDPEEKIAVINVPLPKIWEMFTNGQIRDGKTIIALQYALIQRTEICHFI